MHKYFHNSELVHCAAMHKVLTSVSAPIFWGVRDQCDALKMAITLLKKYMWLMTDAYLMASFLGQCG